MHHRLVAAPYAEKGGKHHEMPCHHNLETYLSESTSKRPELKKAPSSAPCAVAPVELNETRLATLGSACAWSNAVVSEAGLENASMLGNHTFRGTGITAYLSNPDSRLELAQQMAGHADPKTTRMYDRRSDLVSLDEVEKIGI